MLKSIRKRNTSIVSGYYPLCAGRGEIYAEVIEFQINVGFCVLDRLLQVFRKRDFWNIFLVLKF